MKNKVVIGLGFGDEGKGLFTNYLCLKNKKSLVVRFSGGHQVGHTVVNKNIRHAFSNFGSGTLNNIPTYWSRFCTVNPEGLIYELNILKNKGVEPKIFIDAYSPITTPFDILANIKKERKNNHGSIGVGFGETINREENFYSLTFLDLFYSDIFKIKINKIKDFYKTPKIKLERFFDYCNTLINVENIKICFGLPKFKNYIFEGNQGLMLDQHYGFFPNVTRSNTGIKNILEITKNDLELFLITRAYQTRHGNGEMTNENLKHNIKENINETNIYNLYQKKFRRTLLDVSLLEYAINKDEHIKNSKNKNLVITCLDQIENEYRFTYKKGIIYNNSEKEFVNNISNLLKIKNVYISKNEDSKYIKKVK